MRRNRLPPGIDADDLRQAGELAALEARARGDDPEAAREKAVRDMVFAAKRRPERTATDRFGHIDDQYPILQMNSRLGWLPEARKVVGLGRPTRQTPGQRNRFLRDQLILVGSLAGFSQRQLATVFDLPRSRIAVIVEAMRAKTGHP
jgi:hypothetical protein